MKILIIHNAYQFKGGEDSVVANETELLRSDGIEVEVLQFSNAGHALSKVIQLPFNYSSYLKTKEKIKAFKPDVVHIHNLHFAGSPSVVYAIRKCKVPFIITLHNYRLLCPSASLFFNGRIFTGSVNKSFSWDAVSKGVYLNSRILTFWVNCSMMFHQLIGTWKLADKFIALGEHTKEIFFNSKLKSITKDIIVKPNFCYSRLKFIKSVGTYYLYVGRLSEEKGAGLLLKVFSANKLRLKIAGSGPMEKEVIICSKENPNIQFLGSVEKKDVYSLLANATALIFPSQWYETFGMVIIEAFSRSTPVIASNLGQLKITIRNKYNGLHFEAGNADDLTEKVAFYENLQPEEKLTYRRNAFDSYNENYSPEKNLKQLKDIYNIVLGKKNVPVIPSLT